MFRPGYLTHQYLTGRRARYVPPLRLYLTASVLFFIVAAITGNAIRLSWGDADALSEPIEAAADSNDASITIVQEGGCESILVGTDARWSEYWRERAVTACRKVTADSGQSLERAAVDNIPIMMVIFIPVLAIVMKLLYPLSKRYYVEHLVFFLHYHAFGFFMLLLMIFAYEFGVAIDWSRTAWRIVAMIGSGYMALYLFLAMRRVYGQGIFVTSAKYMLLFCAYITGLSVSLFGVMMYTALTL